MMKDGGKKILSSDMAAHHVYSGMLALRNQTSSKTFIDKAVSTPRCRGFSNYPRIGTRRTTNILSIVKEASAALQESNRIIQAATEALKQSCAFLDVMLRPKRFRKASYEISSRKCEINNLI